MGFGWVVGGGVFFGKSSIPDGGFLVDFPDVSVISYTGKPEYERVAFIR